MALWIATLRMTGLGLLAFSVIGVSYLIGGISLLTTPEAYSFVVTVIGSLALGLICLGTAAGLHILRDIDQRTRRHNAALRMLLTRQYQQSDLAPHAPTNWREFKQRPLEPEREKDQGFAHRFAQRHRYTDVNLEDESQQLTRPMIFRRRK